MSTGEVNDPHGNWRYKTHNGSGPGSNIGASYMKVAHICVPYDHIFRSAAWGFTGMVADDAEPVLLYRVAMDGATAETPVIIGTGSQTATLADDFMEAIVHTGLDMSVVHKDVVGPAIYYMQVNQDHAADDVQNPSLAIQVSPIPCGPA